jgi:hypothetical protein
MRYPSLSLISPTSFTSSMAKAPFPPALVLKLLPSGRQIILPANNIRSRKQGDTDGTSNIVLPCPGS